MRNFFFCHYVFKTLFAAEASESVYIRERVMINLISSFSVIDFCLTKNLTCDFETNYTSLQVDWASKANCRQREGVY